MMSVCLHLVALGANEPLLSSSPQTSPVQSCFSKPPLLGRGRPLSAEDHLEAYLFSCRAKQTSKQTYTSKGRFAIFDIL